MSRYIISCLLLLGFFWGQAQNKPIDTKPKDTVVYKQLYGLRVGIDLSRPILSFVYDTYKGLEFVGDYRLTNKLFLAGELGNEKKTRQEDLFNYTTSGSYLKLGIDYNTYSNWYGEQNSIYIGGRYAFSTFSHTLNEYQIFDSNRYWNPVDFATGSTTPRDFSNLNASWLEMLFGAKVELFAHIYLGASVRLGFLISNKQPENFANLFIPGFNKTTEGSRFGVGYNYSLTYFIPFYKKDKKLKNPEKQELQE
ncbi:MAG: DUF6048 family protein [Maribacter sp.]|nr:DUF6048 family protein [Maribacter sp.]